MENLVAGSDCRSSEAKGEPATGVKMPVVWFMVNAETLFEFTLAVNRKDPVGSIAADYRTATSHRLNRSQRARAGVDRINRNACAAHAHQKFSTRMHGHTEHGAS